MGNHQARESEGRTSFLETYFAGEFSHALDEKGRAGSIGGRVLEKFVVYFDYQNKRMILEPPN